MVFCNKCLYWCFRVGSIVTILILIDGFLQSKGETIGAVQLIGHNPYFNRWFSAITLATVLKAFKKMSQSLF